MAIEYVDGDGDFTAAQTGAIDAAYGGPYGLQRALDTQAAGDTIYAKATACRLDRLALLTVQDITGLGWAVGDAVQDNNGGAVWQGTLCDIISVTSIVVECTVASGKYYANIVTANGINNTTRTSWRTLSAKATVPIDIDKNIGTIAARLNIIGTKDDASWTVNGTRFVLDANGVVTNCIKADGTGDYWTLANFELDAATGDGLDTTATCSGCCLENIWSHDHGGHGFDIYNLSESDVIRCRATNNTGSGFYCTFNTLFDSCESIGNTSRGFFQNHAYWTVFKDCISHGNTAENFYMRSGVLINCVVDGSSLHGITMTNALNSGLFLGVRVTNNGDGANEFGLNMPVASIAFLRHCLFTGNRQAGAADGDIGGAGAAGVVKLDAGTATPGGTNIFDGAAAPDDGYTDKATHDFNLTAAARLRSVADLLPDS